MAYEFFMTIKGYKGESQKEGHKDDIPCLRYEWSTVIPVDVNSGDYKGEPQMQPLKIVKEIGAASPQLVQAALHNEVIGEVIIQSMGRAPDGKKEVVKQKITLKDVKIVSHRQYMDKSAKDSGGADVDVLEEVGFRFGEIQIENPEAGTATSWSWKTPNRTK